MKNNIKIILIIISIFFSFWLGIQWKAFWYNDMCTDLGGGWNPEGYPICVIVKK